MSLLIDPITQIEMQVNQLLINGDFSDEIATAMFAVTSSVRNSCGNRTWYLQKSKEVWYYVLFMWESIYKQQFLNELKTKAEIAAIMQSEIEANVGYSYEINTILSMLTDRNIARLKQKLDEHTGKIDDYEVNDTGLLSYCSN